MHPSVPMCLSTFLPLTPTGSALPSRRLLLAAVMLASKHTDAGGSGWGYAAYTRASGLPESELKVRACLPAAQPPTRGGGVHLSLLAALLDMGRACRPLQN